MLPFERLLRAAFGPNAGRTSSLDHVNQLFEKIALRQRWPLRRDFTRIRITTRPAPSRLIKAPKAPYVSTAPLRSSNHRWQALCRSERLRFLAILHTASYQHRRNSLVRSKLIFIPHFGEFSSRSLRPCSIRLIRPARHVGLAGFMMRFRHPGSGDLVLESRRCSPSTICYFAMLNTGNNQLADTYRT